MAIGWWAENLTIIRTALPSVRTSLTGGQQQGGSIASAMKKAASDLAGYEIPVGAIATTLKTPVSASTGIQQQAGTIESALHAAATALAGAQTHSGTATSLLKQVATVLSGAQLHTGTLASALAKAATALAGTVTTPLHLVGANAASTTSVAFPAHAIGDLLIVCTFHANDATKPTVPTAAGTVPAFTDVDAPTFSGGIAMRTARFKATATNHTTGTWTGANGIIAAVVHGQNSSSPIGGHAIVESSGLNVTAPSVTMSNTDGSSLLLHFYATNNVGSTNWGSAPAGYTRQATTGTNDSTGIAMNTKDTTASDGSVDQPKGGNFTNNVGATIEILI